MTGASYIANFLVVVCTLGCVEDIFPRNNPIDPEYTGSSAEAEAEGADAAKPSSEPNIVYVSHEIRDPSNLTPSNNGNGRAEPGEEIYITVELRNDGESTAVDVEATLNSSSECAEVTFAGPLLYGDLDHGESNDNPDSRYSLYEFRVQLSATACEAGSSVPLQLDIEDSLGTKWTRTFDLLL